MTRKAYDKDVAIVNCRHFNGYKPCGKSEICDSLCPHMSVPTARILLVHLEALGAVLRSTALLPAIRRKFPGCHITWVTQSPAHHLLENNPHVDRVLTTSPDDLLALSALEFDIAMVVDKSLKAGGILKKTKAEMVFGFQVDAATGAIVPATPAAEELWQIGLSDRKKFFENRKPETRLVHEALELGPWQRDPYVLKLSKEEEKAATQRRSQWSRHPEQVVVGINTGCSNAIPYKKLSIEKHRDLINALTAEFGSKIRIVLLGGHEDTLRNQRIGHGLDVVLSPTEKGLRDGIVSLSACDIVVSGDSLGLHMAIALGKWTVAWFGPTCAHEIDLYDRGVAVLTKASCSPCWKRRCQRTPMCYDLVSIGEIVDGVRQALGTLKRTENDLDNKKWPKKRPSLNI